MKHFGTRVEDLKIAYIGGGSRGWAWGLMADLAKKEDISGSVYLYDIDFEAAQHNEIIGNMYKTVDGCKSAWDYKAAPTIGEALSGADFVIISILPGTFDEMHSDVHTPEKYGIYQPVGDSTGPGGILRALRTIPMYETIANAIKEFCPKAWVINYTNPMSLCVATLYRVFPQIKAFGCCHEVFGTQRLLAEAIDDICGIKDAKREEIKVNVCGVNHFTWITKAQFRDIDLFPVYAEFAEKYSEIGYDKRSDEEKNHWMNNVFYTNHRVKFDLFRRFGAIAAAGDRHLAEFCPGYWYLHSPEEVLSMGFNLTPVDWRKEDLKTRLQKSSDILSGKIKLELKETGEEGVNQICALLGLSDITTNVNIPNMGQISNLPLGAIVETNASFRTDSVTPIMAGELPIGVYPLVARISGEQEMILNAALNRDLSLAFQCFASDPLTTIPMDKAKMLFDEMVENTGKYLTDYRR